MFENKLHFLIFERFTEEESVLTLAKLLSECGFLVSIFVSKDIFNLIENDLKELKLFNVNIIEPEQELKLKIDEVDSFIRNFQVDLTFITSYSSIPLSEFHLYLKLIK